MGILGLSKLISDVAPGAVKESEIKHYFGKYILLKLQYTIGWQIIEIKFQVARWRLMRP